MTELIDAAQAHEQELTEDARAAQFRRAHGDLTPEEVAAQAANWDTTSALFCADCDLVIPDARRQAVPGVQRCTECEAWHEKWGGR